MKHKNVRFAAAAILLLASCGGQHNVNAAKAEQPLQVFGCSTTERDRSIFESRRKNHQLDGETLDDIAADSDLGLHVCKIADVDAGKRFIVVFAGTGYQGHMALTVVEEK